MRRFLLILLVLVLIPINSYSASFEEIYDNDMTVEFVFYNPNEQDGILNAVAEIIGENDLVPYTSPGGGFGIVSRLDNNLYNFFDIRVQLFNEEIQSERVVIFSFNVWNNSGIPWSDYHFEFYSVGDVITPLSMPIWSVETDLTLDQTNYTNPDETTPAYYSVLDFWSQSGSIAPLGYADFTIELDLSDPVFPQEFMIRQVATTAVPIPSAFVLLASSLVCFAGFRRKLNR